MTDDQIQKLIMKELKRKDVTYYDMVGMPGHGVDPNLRQAHAALREGNQSNRFTTFFGSDRMKELLCVGKYSPYESTLTLKISFQDLFRFWWNRCVEKELVVDDVLEDIYEYVRNLMTPPTNYPKKTKWR